MRRTFDEIHALQVVRVPKCTESFCRVKVVDARVHSAGPGLGGAMAVLVIFPMIHVAIRTAVKRALPIVPSSTAGAVPENLQALAALERVVAAAPPVQHYRV